MNAPQPSVIEPDEVLDNERTTASGPGNRAEQRIGELVREHQAAVMARAVRLTAGDRGWAEDVVQETFIRAWRHIDRMTADYGSVRAWLMRVAHNLVMDGHRARRVQPVDVEEAERLLEPAIDSSDRVLSAVLINDALATLGERHRVVLEQTYLRDRTVVDAARELDLPVGTVKSRVFYGLRQLRESMAPSSRTSN